MLYFLAYIWIVFISLHNYFLKKKRRHINMHLMTSLSGRLQEQWFIFSGKHIWRANLWPYMPRKGVKQSKRGKTSNVELAWTLLPLSTNAWSCGLVKCGLPAKVGNVGGVQCVSSDGVHILAAPGMLVLSLCKHIASFRQCRPTAANVSLWNKYKH